MDITRWSVLKSDWLYSLQPKMEKLYIVNKNKTRSWLWLILWTLIAKFRLKLKKVGKTTRPFRYDLNQIPFDYIVQVTNKFKGLGQIDRLPEELWTEIRNFVQRLWPKPSPRKEMQKGKIVVWGGLTNSWEKKRSKRQKRKGKIQPSECRVPKNSKER